MVGGGAIFLFSFFPRPSRRSAHLLEEPAEVQCAPARPGAVGANSPAASHSPSLRCL